MWRRLIIAMLCAAVSFGFRSNDVRIGTQVSGGAAPGPAPAGNYSGIGNCPSGLYVTGLNKDAPPTCMPVDFAHITGTLTNNQFPTSGLVLNSPTFTGTLTLPDGSLWNASGLTMPAISKITVGNVNITGVAPSLTFNNVPMGGTCTGLDFVNAIDENGVPSCATPAGSGGGLPTPVSVANGGLGQGGAPITGQILVATSATQYTPITVGGDIAFNSITGQFNITSLPATLNGRVTVNATAPTTPIVGDLWFDPVTVQLYIWFQDATGAQWVPTINQPAGGGGGVGPPGPPGGATVTVSATAPVTPTIGELWFDTTTVQMFVWYFDGTSSQWVPVSHP